MAAFIPPVLTGRRKAPDVRDGRYPFSLVAKAGSESTFRLWKYWSELPALDQGQTPQCVGFAWEDWLRSTPISETTGPSPTDIYTAAQQIDEWAGTPHDGTSVRAGAKVVNSLGYIKSYVWATTPDELATWVLTQGPVVVGTDWYEAMFTPNSKGCVQIGGAVAGGHAYLVVGYNKLLKRYKCLNSWGTGWGKKGAFYISENDLTTLVFTNGGEACAAVEQLVVPVSPS